MKIYTKTGDKGKTSLIGGARVSKSHIRIDAYGTVDELNARIGLLRDLPENKNRTELLVTIQDRLFTIGSRLASDPQKSIDNIPKLSEEDISLLEKSMDNMNETIPSLRSFILPGGHPSVSHCHIARCVCRRAERKVVLLAENDSAEEIIIRYLNRLSDFLFVLCRAISHEQGVKELPWKPKI